MKAIQLLVNRALPEDLRNYERSMDSPSIGALMAEVARKYPDKYEEIAKTISDLGRKASYLQGETLTLSDMEPVFDRAAVFAQMDAEIKEAKKVAKNPDEFKNTKMAIWSKYGDIIKKTTVNEALKRNSNLAYSVVSGARGSPDQLKMMVSTPALYTDSNDDIVPIFIRNSFGDGLRPAEYLAGTYGARKSVLSTKRATARGGDLAKQAAQSAVNLLVTTRDCGVKNGIDLDIEDSSLRGRLLGKAQAGLPAGTVLDKQSLAKLRSSGVKNVIARSVMTCAAKNGVCAKCVGLNPKGHFEDIGSAVGITSSQAIGEPITQSALNTKHQGGVATGKKIYSGFDVINRFVQTPEVFPDRAVVAEEDGKIDRVIEAPQGGYFVQVNGNKHYVPPGYPLTVKVGDEVEAGESLSEGLISPGDIVRLRGVGEGRKYYADRLKQILDDSGMKADRRNTEMLARAAIDHVTMTDADEDDPYLPDDVVSYNYMANNYTPDKDAAPMSAINSVGRYLQAPILHYTIGTRVTPKIAKHISSVSEDPVYVSNKGPKFESDMIRLRTAAHSNRDWLASMHTSYLKSQIAESATRGDDTNIRENSHFAPRLAIGENFGTNISTTGKF
jgi:DNA-directed RNA polymerase subunit beta'